MREIIDISTVEPEYSMASVSELEHAVAVYVGDDLTVAKVRSEYDNGRVILHAFVDDAELKAWLEWNEELDAQCLVEWQERFESEACDGPN